MTKESIKNNKERQEHEPNDELIDISGTGLVLRSCQLNVRDLSKLLKELLTEPIIKKFLASSREQLIKNKVLGVG